MNTFQYALTTHSDITELYVFGINGHVVREVTLTHAHSYLVHCPTCTVYFTLHFTLCFKPLLS